MTLIVQAARSMLSGMALLQQILPCMTRPRGGTNSEGDFKSCFVRLRCKAALLSQHLTIHVDEAGGGEMVDAGCTPSAGLPLAFKQIFQATMRGWTPSTAFCSLV